MPHSFPTPKPLPSDRNNDADPTKVPGYRVRRMYERARPLRPMMEHLGIIQLANDRGADWIECQTEVGRLEIKETYRRELAAALYWGLGAIAFETACHTVIAKTTLVIIDATTALFATAINYPWQSAVLLGVAITVFKHRRRK